MDRILVRLIESGEGTGNPFVGEGGDLLIVSVDTLAGEKMLSRLGAPEVAPYDLVIFDEAHKLAARRNADGTITKTERYRMAEVLCGADPDDSWVLARVPGRHRTRGHFALAGNSPRCMEGTNPASAREDFPLPDAPINRLRRRRGKRD